MLQMILFELGVSAPSKSTTKVEAIQRLYDFALDVSGENGNIAVIIDEAHLLTHSTMENLRMLSNLETKKEKLIQFILAGQPELEEKLMLPEWRQLVQRISMKRYSTQFDEENTCQYIKHRLETAGKRNGHIFTGQALKSVFEYTKGIPRMINILCDNAMLIGYGMGKKSIDQSIIAEVIEDLSSSPLEDTIDLTIKKNVEQHEVQHEKIRGAETRNEILEKDDNVVAQKTETNASANVGDSNAKKNMRALKILSLLLICLAVLLLLNR
jgi:hypothetical protein